VRGAGVQLIYVHVCMHLSIYLCRYIHLGSTRDIAIHTLYIYIYYILYIYIQIYIDLYLCT